VDLYSLCIILYEMLTGNVPFDGDSPGEILMKHLTAWPDLNVLQPSYRPLIARLLDKDPQRRYPSMQEMLADLNACAGIPVVPIPQPSAQNPTPPSIQPPREREILKPVLPSTSDGGRFAADSPNLPYLSARDRVLTFFLVVLLIGSGAGFLIFAKSAHSSSFSPASSPDKEAFITGSGAALLISGGVLLLLLLLQWIAGSFQVIVSLLFGVGAGTLVFGLIVGRGGEVVAISMGLGSGLLACALSASLFFLKQHGKKKEAELADTPQPAKTVVPESHLQPTGAWNPPPEEG